MGIEPVFQTDIDYDNSKDDSNIPWPKFLVVMPFVRPPGGEGNTSLPYWLSFAVPLGILSVRIVYFLLRFVLAPQVFGYHQETLQKELSDGSTVTRVGRVEKV